MSVDDELRDLLDGSVAEALAASEVEVAQLHAAMKSRTVIGQASGMCSPTPLDGFGHRTQVIPAKRSDTLRRYGSACGPRRIEIETATYAGSASSSATR